MLTISYNDAHRKATNRWRQKATKAVGFRLHVEHDADIIAYLNQVPNKQGTIKQAIREKMSREKFSD